MARFAGLVIIILLAMCSVLWAVQTPDEITFAMPGYEGSTSRAALTLVIIMLGAVFAVVWWALMWIWDLPGRVRRTARRFQTRRLQETIAEGLLAAEGGDPGAAARAAANLRKVQSDGLGSKRLAMLLQARAHEGDENWMEAERAWFDLSREKGGELAGLRGLSAAAVKRGDARMAILHAQAAQKLRTPATWPFHLLFDLQVRSGDWLAANETLGEGEKRLLIPADVVRRRRAVLLTAEAARKRGDDPAEAERLALEAQKASPGFPPSAVIAARLALAAGRQTRAQTAIETAWRARPHPALAFVWADIRPAEDQRSQARRLHSLVELNPDHRESRILVAEAAILEGDWLKAVETLAPLLEAGVSSRLSTLMEVAARGQGTHEDAHRWSRLAASARREADWSDIDPDGRAFVYSAEEWARLVRTYGDEGQLIHPRHEGFGPELEVLSRIALPSPARVPQPDPPRGKVGNGAGGAAARKSRAPAPNRKEPPVRQVRPPAPDYAPEDPD